MFYINKEKNSLKITDEDFDNNKNYIPTINFIITDNFKKNKHLAILFDMEKTPILFIIYFRNIMRAGYKVSLFFKEDTKILKEGLKKFNIAYNHINNY